MRIRQPLVLILILAALFPVGDLRAKGFDVITMKNGDVHNGVINNKSFNLKTSFGKVVIPYNDMAELHLSSEPYQDKLLTYPGDLFIGDIQGADVIMLRTLDPVLPVAFDGITHIHFSRKKNHLDDINMAALVNSRNGDLFSTRYFPESVNVITANKTVSVSKDNIRVMDIDWVMDDEETIVQIRTVDGRILQGNLDVKKIPLKTAYQQSLNLKLEKLSLMTFIAGDKKPGKQLPIKLEWNPRRYFRDQLNDGSPGPELVKLDSGTYHRGDNAGDDDEKPAMPVSIKAFAIGSHEVTFEQYDQFCDDSSLTRANDQEWGRGSRPVVNVSWENAVAYTKWLSNKTGKVYRLPTDAEWEYAARAGTDTRFWWGNETGEAMANCEGCGSIWGGEKTAPVGRFPANSLGLYDTAGNVFEWVADCYHNTFENAPKDGSAIDKPGCGKRVIRGGAWSFPAKEIRSANRWRDFPTRRSDDTGFRVVRELD